MTKSGLIVGVITLILGTGVTLLSPFCVPCVAILAGAGAGYLAGVFDKPDVSRASARSGAIAGAVGGAGALLGHLIGGAINAMLVGPAGGAAIAQQLGLPVTSDYPAAYYGATAGIACCFGLGEVALMAGLGALGGMLWFRLSGQKLTAPAV
jgi:hypothetical protein